MLNDSKDESNSSNNSKNLKDIQYTNNSNINNTNEKPISINKSEFDNNSLNIVEENNNKLHLEKNESDNDSNLFLDFLDEPNEYIYIQKKRNRKKLPENNTNNDLKSENEEIDIDINSISNSISNSNNIIHKNNVKIKEEPSKKKAKKIKLNDDEFKNYYSFKRKMMPTIKQSHSNPIYFPMSSLAFAPTNQSQSQFIKNTLEIMKKPSTDEMVILSTLTELNSQLSLATDSIAEDPNTNELIHQLIIFLDKYPFLPDISLYCLNCLNYLLDINPRYTTSINKFNGASKIIKLAENVEYIDCVEASIKCLEKMSYENSYSLLEKGCFYTVLQFIDFFDLNLRKTCLKICVNLTKNECSMEYFNRFICSSVQCLTGLTYLNGNTEIEKDIANLSILCFYQIANGVKNFNYSADLTGFADKLTQFGIVDNLYGVLTKFFDINKEKNEDDDFYLINNYGNNVINKENNKYNVSADTIKTILKLLEVLCSISNRITNYLLEKNSLEYVYKVLCVEFDNKNERNNSNSSNNDSNNENSNKLSTNSHSLFSEILNLLISFFPNKTNNFLPSNINMNKNNNNNIYFNIKIMSQENKKYFSYFSEKIIKLIIDNILNIPTSSTTLSIIKLLSMYCSNSDLNDIIKYIDDNSLSNSIAKMLDSKDSSYILEVLDLVEIIMMRIPDHFIISFLRDGVVENIKKLISIKEDILYIPKDLNISRYRQNLLINNEGNNSNNINNANMSNVNNNLYNEPNVNVFKFKKSFNPGDKKLIMNNNFNDDLNSFNDFDNMDNMYENRSNVICKIINKNSQNVYNKYFTNENVILLINNIKKKDQTVKDPIDIMNRLIQYSNKLKNINNLNNQQDENINIKEIVDLLLNNNVTFFEVEKSEIILNLCNYFDTNFILNYNTVKESSNATDPTEVSLTNNYNRQIIKNINNFISAFDDQEKIIRFVQMIEKCISSMNCFKLLFFDNDSLSTSNINNLFMSAFKGHLPTKINQTIKIKFVYDSSYIPESNINIINLNSPSTSASIHDKIIKDFKKMESVINYLNIDLTSNNNSNNISNTINKNNNNKLNYVKIFMEYESTFENAKNKILSYPYWKKNDNFINCGFEEEENYLHDLYRQMIEDESQTGSVPSHRGLIQKFIEEKIKRKEALEERKREFLRRKKEFEDKKREMEERKKLFYKKKKEFEEKEKEKEKEKIPFFKNSGKDSKKNIISNNSNSSGDEIDRKYDSKSKSGSSSISYNDEDINNVNKDTKETKENKDNMLIDDLNKDNNVDIENSFDSQSHSAKDLSNMNEDDIEDFLSKYDIIFFLNLKNGKKYVIPNNLTFTKLIRELKTNFEKNDFIDFFQEFSINFCFIENTKSQKENENDLLNNSGNININKNKLNDILMPLESSFFEPDFTNSNFSVTLDSLIKILFEKYYYSSILNNKSLYNIKRASPFFFILSLLELMSSHFNSYFHMNTIPINNFENLKVSTLLLKQIRDPYSVAQKSIPSWCKEVINSFNYFSNFQSRYLLFKATSFDPKRSMINLYNFLKNFLGENMLEGKKINKNSSNIKRIKYKIHRDRIIQDTYKLYENNKNSDNGFNNSFLEFEYFGETGTGLGPTLEYYTLFNKEITNVPNIWYKTEDNSLFPMPILSNADSHIKNYFISLGYVIARGLYDDRVIDIPINKLFWDLVLDRPINYDSIAMVDKNLSSFINDVLYTNKYNDQKVIDEMDIYFTSPWDNSIPLKKDGDKIKVNLENISEYIYLVLNNLLFNGQKLAVNNFLLGFNSVFDISNLKCFSSEEIEDVVCGCGSAQDSEWTYDNLVQNITPQHGYNKNSQIFKWLIEIMTQLNNVQRKQFLLFVTGSPRLPIGGFKNLNPKLTVVMFQSEISNNANSNLNFDITKFDSNDYYLPSVMTCQNYLKIPNYSDFRVLKEKLIFAMTEGANAFHLS